MLVRRLRVLSAAAVVFEWNKADPLWGNQSPRFSDAGLVDKTAVRLMSEYESLPAVSNCCSKNPSNPDRGEQKTMRKGRRVNSGNPGSAGSCLMISNNLWALLATPVNRSLLSARVRALHANTLGHWAHAHNSHLFSSTNTHTGAFVCRRGGVWEYSEICKDKHIHKPRFTRGTSGITNASVSVRSSTFCLSRCGFQRRQPLDCTPRSTCFALKLLDCVYTSSQPHSFY